MLAFGKPDVHDVHVFSLSPYVQTIIMSNEVVVSEILPNLYLGSYAASKNVECLQDKNIQLIINCTKDLEFPTDYFCVQVRLPIDDIYTADETIRSREISKMNTVLDPMVDLIHSYVANGKGVLVHCLHGIQRSATIVTAYLLKHGKNKMSIVNAAKPYTSQFYLDQAIQHVINKRAKAFVGGRYINFAKVLKTYDKQCWKRPEL